MMAGYLLARAGVPVAILEKHVDFNRDFRGDTIHPSTLELMNELGLLDEFLKQPHQEVRELRAVVNGRVVPVADFTKLPTRCKFIRSCRSGIFSISFPVMRKNSQPSNCTWKPRSSIC